MTIGRPAIVVPRAAAADLTNPPDGAPLDAILRIWADGGGTREFEVTGESMHPILEGIRRLRARMGAERVRFGDVVLFYRDRKLIAHRVVGRGGGGFRTRGDASKGFDPGRLPRAQVLGVVTHLLRPGAPIPLEGAGATLVRPCLGLLSLAAGVLRISPRGRGGRRSVAGGLRDALLGPPYRGALRALFAVYVALSQVAERGRRLLAGPPRRDLLCLLDPRRPLSAVSGGPGSARSLARRAVRLGMGPVLWQRLQEARGSAAFPEDVVRDLERTWYAQALYNTVALRELAGVLAAMAEEGVRPVVLKGAALLGRTYPSVALRVLSDLDILVGRDEVEAADRALRRCGYATRGREVEERYRGHHHLAPYMPPRGHPRIEVHTGILHPSYPQPDLGRMRARALPAEFGETRAWIFRPEDQLVHACLHLSLSDRFVRGVKDLTDIDRLARQPAFDWGLVLESAERREIGRPIHYALALARRVFDTPVPDPARARIRRHRLPHLEDALLRATTLRYVTALPDPDDAVGTSMAKGFARMMLSEPRMATRWAWIGRRLLGRAREEGRPPLA